MPIVAVTPEEQQRLSEISRQAWQLWNDGQLVVIPTETVYGLSVLVTHDKACTALSAKRPESVLEGLTVHLAQASAAQDFADFSHPLWQRMLEKLWPGPVTIRVEVSESQQAVRAAKLGLAPHQQARIYSQGAVSLRCPDHLPIRRILADAPGPVVAVPVIGTDHQPVTDATSAHALYDHSAGLVIDGGPCRYAKPSTVIRLREREGWPVVVMEQEGVYDERTIRRMTRITILFVCTGNTCRSPMAEAIARAMLAQQRGLAQDELETAGIRIVSAGVFGADGAPASEQAVEALADEGLDLNRHRSRMLTTDMLRDADRVFCMTENHLQAVKAMFPEGADRMMCLDQRGDIMDPIGSSLAQYQRCAANIQAAITARFKEFFP
ncbi:MAG: hypothetical protein HC898_07700 [Phycisphaerales bacterium]|nr:hypothetical protein [Phycisphaerales bacterium]